VDAIATDNLSRRFGERVAVGGLSFAVARGEVFGLLGPNGAGKTTTINMLTCQLRPSGGSARLLGHDIRQAPQAVKPLIGVVFEEQNLYERMSGRENLAFTASLYGVPGARVDLVLEQVGLRERAKDRVAKYSNGMRQRLIIARALLHQPQILFLDEPTRALDPAATRQVRELVAELGRQGVTVFLTTHDMDEADRLCGRVAIMDLGRIVALDSPRALRLSFGHRVATVLRRDGSEQTFSLDDAGEARLLAALVQSGDLLAVHSQEATLEDAFIALTGRKLLE
jgi:ABC-2 type transport system ATP-binding protein